MAARTRDIHIRVSGLIQAIIASGAEPDTWEDRLKHAYKIHARISNKLIDGGKINGEATQDRDG